MTTFTLAARTESGSYEHRITFKVLGETVAIVERMFDELMGDWIGASRDRTVALVEARAYYRDRRQHGYR